MPLNPISELIMPHWLRGGRPRGKERQIVCHAERGWVRVGNAGQNDTTLTSSEFYSNKAIIYE